MISPRDFRPLNLCKPCKRLFVNCDDPAGGESIQIQMLTTDGEGGYSYTRIQKDVEVAAIWGCVFCRAVISDDERYIKKNDKKEIIENDESDDEDWEDDDDDEDNDSEEDDDDENVEYGEDIDEEEEKDPRRWSRPWDADYELMMVYDPDHKGFGPDHKAYEPRPAWFPPLDEQLNLQLRYDSVNNYLGIYNIGHHRSRYIEWGLFATEDDPASRLVSARAVLPDFNSSKTFAVARQWLTECLTNHPECPAHIPVDLPTRLVRVSSLGEPESARLCYTQGQKGHYCALSYCWGDDQPSATTAARYDTYLEALPYEILPQTIRDAFQVARSLGMQYIWIDSLCIIQKDPDDVPRELAKMLRIYLDAQFTISAASAKNCNKGFLKTSGTSGEFSNGPFFLPLRVDEDTMGSVLVSEGSSSWAQAVSRKQPINERAWTLQEAMLTPRLLMFTDVNMVWRCQAGFEPDFVENIGSYSERHRGYSPNMERNPWHKASRKWGYAFDSLKEIQVSPKEDIDREDAPDAATGFGMMPQAPVWQRFRSMVELYSKRKITEQADKLPAISALAEAFAQHIQCDYLAGLWRRYLVYDLMWWVDSYAKEKAEKPEAPSWSWASTNSSISFNHSECTRAMAEIEDCHVTLAPNQNPFGAVTGGELVIRGYLKEMVGDKRRGLVDQTGKVVHGEIIPDGRKERFKNKFQLWCFTLGNAPFEIHQSEWVHQSILLVKSEDFPDAYRRVGYFRGGSTTETAWWEQCDKATITIV